MTGIWLLVLIAVQFEPSQGLYAPPVDLYPNTLRRRCVSRN